ncbi:MAG: nucleoside triphosphate pyrophosphohydrolase [Clostridiales bacterium]|nr:nucleoside triphosphate pyrophosphohydrolase [Clostridiales bacterium]
MDEFLKIMDRLLSEDGCPWDRVQTHESLERYLIEECYEVIDAIDKKSSKGLCEELGDVLLQVVFHSKLAEKEGLFSFDDVVKGVSEKMVNRHPHVFADGKAENPDEVLTNWEEIKKKEKHYKNDKDILESIPRALPALMRAEKLVGKAEKPGLVKLNKAESIKAVRELLNKIELSDNDNKDEISADIGDILFEMAKISKLFKINPEFVLTNSSEKFITNIRPV